MTLNTLFTGRNRLEPESTGSTNSFAASLLKSGKIPEGTVVVTRNQTAGRGQRGAGWVSDPGFNLTVSIIFYPFFITPAHQFMLNVFVSLAVREFAESQSGQEIKIKWPNDIYAGDKKLAGILIENSVSDGKIASSVIGIGFNINQVVFPESVPNPVSLKGLTGRDYSLEECLDNLLNIVEARYLQLKEGHFSDMIGEYRNALHKLNEPACFCSGQKKFQGRISGVSDEGRLIITVNGGEVLFFSPTEIKLISE